MNKIGFGYDPAILERFPNVCGGVLLVQEIANSNSPESFVETYMAEQQSIRQKIGNTPLSELLPLAAWRGAFRAFGVDPTKYRSAAEALLRRLVKKGDIPTINILVDVCNLVSIRHALPAAAFDTRHLNGMVAVRFAQGMEAFLPHDQEQAEQPDTGEVIFIDEAGLVVARRWCWKQSRESVVDNHCREAMITIEAQHPDSDELVREALLDARTLLESLLGGIYQQSILDYRQPEFRSN